ncbi:MAG: CapA family protein [Chlorobiaceae bacterium]|nr:CapA family protein [Chlorobiaceae bacterium]
MVSRCSPAGYLRTFRRALLAFFLVLAGAHPAEAGSSPAALAGQDGLTIVAVGDIMMGSGYPSPDGLPPGRSSLLAPVDAVLAGGDVTFGNLEGPLLNDGDAVKKCADPSKCFAFRQPEQVAGQLADAGFDLLSVANNHINDFGLRGKNNTMRLLAEKRIGYAGLDSCPTTIVVRNGLRVGFTTFAPVTGCLNLNDDELVRRVVSGLRRQCDIVVVSFHGGAEGAGHTHVTRQSEMFYGENRGNAYRFARLAIDSGADVVLGHGPHVPRAIDLYKGKFIAYSLGNFCTYGQFNLKGPNGIAPILRIQLSKSGDFIGGRIISVMQQGKGGPVIDPSGQALDAIRKLTESDIPELKVKFDPSGKFSF